MVVYKQFIEPGQAKELTSVLSDHGIKFEVSESTDSLPSFYGDNSFNKQYSVKIHKEDFAKVDSVLLQLGDRDSQAVSKDHYLFSFNQEELFDVINKPDEWSELDFQLARNILKERGREITDDTIELLRAQRLKDLAKPDESSKSWIFAGYLFAFLGGYIGIFMGISMVTAKKSLPNGQKVAAYSSNVRRHGKRIIIISISMITISLSIRLLPFIIGV